MRRLMTRDVKDATGRFFTSAAAIAAVLACIAGCGERAEIEDARTAVSGTVSFQGKPLPGGSITFVSTENPEMRVTCMIRPDGSFSVADAPIGPVQAAVETESIALGDSTNYVEISARYAQPDTSGLTSQIQPGENVDLRFDLE